jgi:hypothetical protein
MSDSVATEARRDANAAARGVMIEAEHAVTDVMEWLGTDTVGLQWSRIMVDKNRAMHVKLTDIIEGLEFLSDEDASYLNSMTGEVVYITAEGLRAAEEDLPLDDFPEWQHDMIRTAKDILATDHFIPLPTKFDIHEYRIMERFCLSVDDDDMRDDLCEAIRGRGAFGRFKDRIHLYDLVEEWYQYRDVALREIAIAWCEEHGIQYTET